MSEEEDFSLDVPTLSLQCKSERGGKRGGANRDPAPKQLTAAAEEEEEFLLDLPTCTLIDNAEDSSGDTDNASDLEEESVAEQPAGGGSRAALGKDATDVSDETAGPRDEEVVCRQHKDEVKLDQITRESLDLAHGNIWPPGEPEDAEKLDLEVEVPESAQQEEAPRQEQRGKDCVAAETVVRKRSRPDEQQRDKSDKLRLLASECQRLQGQLDNERQLTRKLHQEQKETRRSLEEEAEREKAWSLQVYKKYKKLKKASTETPGIMYDMETLRLQNKIIVTKFEALEERYKDMVSQKDDKISKHEATIDKLQDKLRTRKLKMRMRQSRSDLDLKEDAKRDSPESWQRSSDNARVQGGPLDGPRGTLIPGVDMNELASAIKQQERQDPDEADHTAFENERLFFERRLQGETLDSLLDGLKGRRRQDDPEVDADTPKLLSHENYLLESGSKRLQGQEASNSSQLDNVNVVHLTLEVQQLSTENNRLRSELWDVLHSHKDADSLRPHESQLQVAESEKEVQELDFENNRLRGELEEALHSSWCAREAAACQQREDAEKLKQLTLENRQLVFELRRLEAELGESKRDQQTTSENKRLLVKFGDPEKADCFDQRLVSDDRRPQGDLEDALRATQCAADSTSLASENRRLKDEMEERQDVNCSERSTFEIERLWAENSRLQSELEDALCENRLAHEASASGCQQRDEAAKLEQATLENQQLLSENKRLRSEVEEALWDKELAEKQQQVDSETRRRLQDEVKQERARFMRVYKKLERLRNSPDAAEEATRQPELEDRPRPHLHQEIMTQRDVIADHLATIAKLQCTVDSLGAHQSESRARQEQLEEALSQERRQRAAAEERARLAAAALDKERKRAAQIAAALRKEKALSKKYSAALQEMLNRQAAALEHQQQQQQQQQHLLYCPPTGSDFQWT